MNTAIASKAIETPQEKLAAILDSHQPRSLLTVSLNPVPVAQHWCDDHDCELISIQELDPFKQLEAVRRVDMAVVADQLEYMNQKDGEALLVISNAEPWTIDLPDLRSRLGGSSRPAGTRP